MKHKQMMTIRSKEIAFISQDPMTSLNPTMKIGKQLNEVFVGVRGVSASEAEKSTLQTMRDVGMNSRETHVNQTPHPVSGGTRQLVKSRVVCL